MSVVERNKSVSGGVDHVPSHFVVALDGPEGRSFAICERIMMVDADQADLPVEELARFVRKNALTAAAFPAEALAGDPLSDKASSAWLRTATFAQSADEEEEDAPGEEEEKK